MHSVIPARTQQSKLLDKKSLVGHHFNCFTSSTANMKASKVQHVHLYVTRDMIHCLKDYCSIVYKHIYKQYIHKQDILLNTLSQTVQKTKKRSSRNII